MMDGKNLSLYVKNIPLTKEEKKEPTTTSSPKKKGKKGGKKEGGGGAKKEAGKKEGEDKNGNGRKEPFRPRYSVTRAEIKTLFEPYGRVGAVALRFGRSYSGSRSNRARSHPLGAATVEFESREELERACDALIVQEDGNDAVLEIKGHKLAVERMKDGVSDGGRRRKRSRDDGEDDNEKKADAAKGGKESGPAEDVEFEPVALDWQKGCVISLAGLSAAACDRESIREAVSGVLGVAADAGTSGLHVDYSRGASSGYLRLKEPKSAEMKELVRKLNKGTVKVADKKVKKAKLLAGEEEKKYWKELEGILNKRKSAKKEEGTRSNKQTRAGGRGNRRGKGEARQTKVPAKE